MPEACSKLATACAIRSGFARCVHSPNTSISSALSPLAFDQELTALFANILTEFGS
jgi:hypothetical protein